MTDHPRPAVLHSFDCRCADCDRPAAPSDVEPSAFDTALEMVAFFGVGMLLAWLLSLAIDGPGLQVMIGLPA